MRYNDPASFGLKLPPDLEKSPFNQQFCQIVHMKIELF